MKQIGARQEAARIGGLGACGRELCCASWISSFSSVTTGAARVQDISLNPQKLAGQCSKLKCCMMYEYDAYVEASKEFPRLREPLQTADGEWFFVKNDLLAGTMTFSSSKDSMTNVTTLSVERVKEIVAQNRAGKKVDHLQDADDLVAAVEEPNYRTDTVEDSITRFDKARRRKRGGRNRDDRQREGQREGQQSSSPDKEGAPRSDRRNRGERTRSNSDQPRGERNNRSRGRNRRRQGGGDTKDSNGGAASGKGGGASGENR